MNRTFCRDGFKDGVHGHWQFWYEGYPTTEENRRYGGGWADFVAERNASNPAYAKTYRKAA